MNTTNGTPARGSGAGRFAIVLLVGAAGMFAGVRWHSWFERLPDLIRGNGAVDGVASTPADRAGPRQLWTCSMHPQVIREAPGLCPICHMKLTPLNVATGSASAASSASAPSDGTTAGRKVKYWWDPMLSPPYISDRPGKSPMGMDLVPVYEDVAAASANEVLIDPAVVQNMGVRVATVTEGPLDRSLRLVGYLDEAEPNVHDVNLRVSGWIRRLHANTEGQHVMAGDPLFDLYSPELQVAIEELITSRRAVSDLASGAKDAWSETAGGLFSAATQKLELLGLERAQIEALAKLDHAPETVTFVSPIMGHVTEKLVVEGAAVKAGDRVLRIVDHSTLWLNAQVFEKDLQFVQLGAKVEATIASRPGEPVHGAVIFVHPHVDMTTRTGIARIAIENPTLDLKPGMYAVVHVRSRVAERAVLVPREAIIDAGDRQVAFIARAVGKFEPRPVRMGPAGDDGMVSVLEGLAPGDVVVTSGQFLLDSESRMREAINKFLAEKRDATASGAKVSASPGVDAVVTAYLAVADALGQSREDGGPIDAGALVAAGHALRDADAGSSRDSRAAALVQAAEALTDQPIEQQRELFKPLSEQIIALIEASPPSRAVGDRLYVMHCDMAPGNWVQRSQNIANPFYATDMKQCGSLQQTLTLK